jgi:hypothetical protein
MISSRRVIGKVGAGTVLTPVLENIKRPCLFRTASCISPRLGAWPCEFRF